MKNDKKRPGGRKKLGHLKRKKYDYYLNDIEYRELTDRMKTSSHNQVAAFVRSLILQENRSARHLDPTEFMKRITELTRQVGKLGNNINQLAHHANTLANENRLGAKDIRGLDEKIESYAKLQRELISQLKSVMKG